MGNPYLDTQLISTGYLNTVDDATPGKSYQPDSMWGFNGLLKKLLLVDDSEALLLSDTTIGTLYGGEYMYVQTKAASSVAPARGLLAFWDTLANSGIANGVVTPDSSATNITQVAGVYLSAPTKGNYCWIQTLGRASVKALASLTNAAIGNIAFVDVTPTGTFDANTEASITIRQYTKKLGVCYQLPANATITQVVLQSGGAIIRPF